MTMMRGERTAEPMLSFWTYGEEGESPAFSEAERYNNAKLNKEILKKNYFEVQEIHAVQKDRDNHTPFPSAPPFSYPECFGE